MASESKIKTRLSEIVQTNGLLITVFLTASVFLGGIALISNLSNWWVPITVLAVGFIAIFTFINAAVVAKIAISIVALLLTAAFSFQAGVLVEPESAAAFVWLAGTLAVYFGCLALSYLISSGQSRWSLLTLSLILYFIAVFTVGSLGLNLVAVAAAMVPTIWAIYGIIFRFGGKSRFSEDSMPQNFFNSILEQNIPIAAGLQGLEARKIEKDSKQAFITWNTKAYLLYPVSLDQAFGVIGKKKKTQLSYKGKPINNWLRFLNFKLIPTMKARQADIMLVLVDIHNANGKDPKVIGVSIPDSKAVVPVGILPGKLLNETNEKTLSKALQYLDQSFESYLDELKPKQLKALEDFGE